MAVSSSKEELLSAIWTATGKGMPDTICSRTAQVRVGDNEIIVRAPGFRRKTVNVNVSAEQPNEAIVELKSEGEYQRRSDYHWKKYFLMKTAIRLCRVQRAQKFQKFFKTIQIFSYPH